LLLLSISPNLLFAQAPDFRKLWQAGGTADDLSIGTAVDKTGNVYFIATFLSTNGTLTGPGVNQPCTTGGLLTKFNPSGNLVWTRQAQGTNIAFKAITVDDDGNVYITGSYAGTNSFGLLSPLSSSSDTDYNAFVLKYSPDGEALVARPLGNLTGQESGNAIAVDPNTRAIYVAGFFDSPLIDFAGTNILKSGITANGASDIFIAKFADNGEEVWIRSGTSTQPTLMSAAADSQGHLLVAGTFINANTSFGTTVLTNNTPTNRSEIYLVKYDASGNLLWARSAGGTNNDTGTGVAADAAGNIYLTGSSSSSNAMFGTIPFVTQRLGDLFLAKYDPQGTALWVRQVAGLGTERGDAVALDAATNIYVAASFSSTTLTLGGMTFTNRGVNDILLLKYDASGNLTWATNAGGNSTDEGFAIAVNPRGIGAIAGLFVSTDAEFSGLHLTNRGQNDAFLATFGFPELGAQRSGGQLVFTWPTNGTSYSLESTTNVATGPWSPVTNAPVIINGQKTVTNTASDPRRFFRLRNY
jgi:hypothetical protein